jgi:hypothetical protein
VKPTYISGIKRRDYLKGKIKELPTNSKNKKMGDI